MKELQENAELRELYGYEPDEFMGVGYDDLLASFEVEVLLRVDDDDYQGDSRVLLRDGGRYGLLIFGWGSCSGCDALQACNSLAEATELRDRLWNSVHWEPSATAMLDHIGAKDWDLEWYGHSREHEQFLVGVNTVLHDEVQA